MYLSGTSMSTPAVAGAAAVLLEANSSLTPNMIKMLLMYTAQPLPGFNTFEQGAGQLNVTGAVALAKIVNGGLLGLLKPTFGSNLADSNCTRGPVNNLGHDVPVESGTHSAPHHDHRQGPDQ